MPSWPMAMPSSTAMVSNSLATPPAASISRATSWPRSFRCTWPGTNWVKELAMAMIGLPKSPSLHAGRAPKAARAGHVAAMGRSAGAIRRHVRACGLEEDRRDCARASGAVIIAFFLAASKGAALGDDGSPTLRAALTSRSRIARNGAFRGAGKGRRGCSSMVEQQPSKLNSCFFAALHGISQS